MVKRKTNIVLRILVWAFLIPILASLMIIFALYVPAIQQLVKNKVATTASSVFGQKITIGRIGLRYPFDLTVEDIAVVDRDIQRAHLSSLRFDINPLPLINKEISIDKISLSDASFNQFVPINGYTLSGSCDKIQLVTRSIYLKKKSLTINRALVRKAFLNLKITNLKKYTTTLDTFKSHWNIFFEKLMTENSRIVLSVPSDSLALDISWHKFNINNAKFSLNPFAFNIPKSEFKKGQFFYSTHIDSLYVSPILDSKDLNINIDSLKADSIGFSLKNIKVALDSSWIRGSISGIGPWQNILTWAEPNKLDIELDADIKKNLLLQYWPDSNHLKLFPVKNLLMSFRLQGLNKNIFINRAAVNCSPLFDMKMNGKVSSILHNKNRSAFLEISSSLPERYDFKSNIHLLNDSLSLDLILNQRFIGRKDSSVLKNVLTLFDDSNSVADSLNISLREDNRSVDSTRIVSTISASYELKKNEYSLDFDVDSLVLQTFFPEDSLKCITMHVKARGIGLDPFAKETSSQITGRVSSFRYGPYNVQNIDIDAAIIDAMAEVNIESRWPELQFHADGNYELHKDETIRGEVNLNIISADLYKLGLLDKPTNKPSTMDFQGEAAKDTLWLSLYSGDAMLSLYAGTNLEKLILDGNRLINRAKEMKQNFYLDYNELLPELPMTNVALFMGKDNFIAWWLRQKGIYFERLQLEATTEPNWGIDADGLMQDLRYDTIYIDSLQLLAQQDNRKLNYRLSVTDNHVNHPERDYDVILQGILEGHKFNTRLYYNDYKQQKGLDIGLDVVSKDSAFSFKVFPEEPIIAFQKFYLRNENQTTFYRDGHADFALQLLDSVGQGFMIQSIPDSTALYNVDMELTRVTLSDISRLFPAYPEFDGLFSATATYRKTKNDRQLSTELFIEDGHVRKNSLGNINCGLAWLPDESMNKHYVDTYLMHNDREVLTTTGSYFLDKKRIELDSSIKKFPMKLVSAFLDPNMVKLTGTLDGQINVIGSIDKPTLNGAFTSNLVELNSKITGAYYRFDPRSIEMINNELIFDHYSIYSRGDAPFIINGKVDCKDISNLYADLSFNADKYTFLDAKRTEKSLLYGKVLVDMKGSLFGPIDNLKMNGDMRVRSGTNLTYLMLNSPLTIEDRLGDAVTFTSFANQELQKRNKDQKEMSLGSFNINMHLFIDPVVRLRADLSADKSSFISLRGGGELNLSYSNMGDLSLSGRYSVTSGSMKYTLPVIPLNEFIINKGSSLLWQGDPMDPMLNIKAYKMTSAIVSQSNGSGRSVDFNVGINLNNTLQSPDFSFFIESPHDNEVRSQLATMSQEQRNKQALTMLATGIYLGNEGYTQNLNIGSVISNVLQSQISNIAEAAVSGASFKVGVNQVDNSTSGSSYTDYNFSYKQRLFDDRFQLVVGGSVVTGNPEEANHSFINNASLEYRLDYIGTKYLRMFYERNYDTLLEGDIIKTGVGFIYKKKMSSLSELWHFKKQKKIQQENDSINTKKINE